MLELDNTSRVCFDSCERKFYYRHRIDIVPLEPQSMAPFFGISIHKGVEAFYQLKDRDDILKAFGEEYSKWYDGKDEDRTVSNAIIILDEYCKRFKEDYLETVVIDEKPLMEIGGSIIIEGGGIIVNYKSRIDRIPLWKVEGKLVIEDWKTSKYVGSNFTILKPNNQFCGYALTVREMRGENLEFFLTLIGTKVKNLKRKKKYEEGEEARDEGGEERIDIVRDYTKFSEEDFEEFKRGVIDTALRIQRCEETNYWPKRTHSCPSFSGCEYLPLCRSNKESESEMIKQFYKIEKWRPYE